LRPDVLSDLADTVTCMCTTPPDGRPLEITAEHGDVRVGHQGDREPWQVVHISRLQAVHVAELLELDRSTGGYAWPGRARSTRLHMSRSAAGDAVRIRITHSCGTDGDWTVRAPTACQDLADRLRAEVMIAAFQAAAVTT
jgi:hypothetical protein